MKLDRAVIHNYRGIIDAQVEFSAYSLVVGPNNGGKSTVINALRAFYEKDGFKYKKDSDFPYKGAVDEESWIELTFGLDDDEFSSLPDDYKAAPGTLRVRKFFQTKAKTHDNKSCTGSIFAYQAGGELSDKPFFGAKNVQSGKLGELIYIPAVSKVDEHTKLSGPSALRDLLTEILSEVIGESAAYKALADEIESFSAAIKAEKTGDDRSLGEFESKLNGHLGPWHAEFALRFPPPSSQDIIKSMLEWELKDQEHGEPHDVDQFGSGFQRHFIYSLIQIKADYMAPKKATKEKEFSPVMTLLLFEEPEAFLHPPQQEVLARGLREAGTDEAWQVICATHSAHFVSRKADDVPAVARTTRCAGVITVSQFSTEGWKELVDANQAIHSIAERFPSMKKKLESDDMRPEMEAVKHFLWLNADRSCLFFADYVLLVEGPSEAALIPRLIDDGLVRCGPTGVVVVDTLGKWNTHRFMNLLCGLEIPHAVLYDDDDGKDEHEAINGLIENTRHPELTKRTVALPGSLEKYLDILSAGSSHRKPQHVMYLYESGNMDPEKLEAFCRLIQSCIPGQEEDDS